MSNPNSPLTWTRFLLARWLDPYPDKGEAWCIGCELNGGRTLILNAAGHVDHIKKHREQDNPVEIRVNLGSIPGREPG